MFLDELDKEERSLNLRLRMEREWRRTAPRVFASTIINERLTDHEILGLVWSLTVPSPHEQLPRQRPYRFDRRDNA
jgi:hypothetical protein